MVYFIELEVWQLTSPFLQDLNILIEDTRWSPANLNIKGVLILKEGYRIELNEGVFYRRYKVKPCPSQYTYSGVFIIGRRGQDWVEWRGLL